MQETSSMNLPSSRAPAPIVVPVAVMADVSVAAPVRAKKAWKGQQIRDWRGMIPAATPITAWGSRLKN